MKARYWLSLVALIAIVACAPPPPPEEPAVDLESERSALMEADEAWSESADNVDSFMSFLADDATFLPYDAPLARGDEIRAVWEQLSSMPGFALQWQATSAEVAEAGDVGYTIGTFELTVEQDGTPMVTEGKYVTVWEKQADGSWKVVVDCFNANGPPSEP